MKTVAVFSVKGGVGKTAIAVNLAHAAASVSGRKTLLWDLDAQGAASYMLRVAPKTGGARKLFAAKSDLTDHILATDHPNLDVLPADKSLRQLERTLAEEGGDKQLKRLLKGLGDDYDRIVLDCPPGLSQLAEQVFEAADLIVAPEVPSPLSARALEQLRAHLAKHRKGKPPIIPVFSMVDRRRKLHAQAIAAAPAQVAIPYATGIEQMAVHRAPIAELAPKAAPAKAFADLWRQVELALLGRP